jgi:peptide/nickel transport system permease protein
MTTTAEQPRRLRLQPIAVGPLPRAVRAAGGYIGLARAKPLGTVSLAIILVLVLAAVFAEQVAPYDPLTQNYTAVLQPPSAAHPFGTDNLGRDVFSRIIFGARISLIVGLSAMLIGILGGTLLGLSSGYFGGWYELLVERVVDAWLAFPIILFALTIVAVLGAGVPQTIAAIGFVSIPGVGRVVRGATLAEKECIYILAARSCGATGQRIMLRHVLPNLAAPLIVIASLTLARAILTEASLSFLGVGVPPPDPAWGSMLSGESRTYMLAAPWLAIWPGLAISLAVMCWNMLGDALRDLLDPRLRNL